MKRCRFGLGLLVLILVLGLISGTYLDRFCTSAGRELVLAARSPAPEEAVGRVLQRWEAHRFLAAVLWDHAALEAIEEEFRILRPEAEDFGETCLRLAAKLQALGRSQKLSWENVL